MHRRMGIEYCGICDKGMKRTANQDAVFMTAGKGMGLFVVADGMGGHMYGEEASGIIVTELKRWWERTLETRQENAEPPFESMVSSLKTQLSYANRIIYEQYNSGDDVCGSTVVVLLIIGRHFCVLSSGDSRVYCLRGRRFEQITVDDVWENCPEAAAEYQADSLANAAFYGRLVHAIGVCKDAVISENADGLAGDTCFLLCSDGLYKMCDPGDVKKLLRRYKGRGNGEALLRGIMKKVYANGARDNVSVILVRWSG